MKSAVHPSCATVLVLAASGSVTAFLPVAPGGVSVRSSPLRSSQGTSAQSQWQHMHPRAMALRRRLQVLAAEGGQDREQQSFAQGGINVSGEAPFEIRGFSLGTAFLLGGLALTIASFTEYFLTEGSEGLSGLGFVYGIPVSLIGLALKYAELAPVPVETTPEASELFEVKGTETMKKIKKDVTRHRYGDEAHLDTTVKTLGLVMPQSDYPQLIGLKEEVEANGELGFSMVFQSKQTPYKRWVEPARIKKYNAFFGPGVDASVVKVNSEERIVAIKLVTVDPANPPKQADTDAAAEAAADAATDFAPKAPEQEKAAA